MSIDNLLNRLEKVRSTGKSKWMARCPAHNDKNPSLSIGVNNDGRILVHCFAGCDTYSVLSSVGLEMTDLQPELIGNFKRLRKPFPAEDILSAVGLESLVVINSANQLLNQGGLNFVEKERLSLAISRLQAAVNISGVDS